MFSLRGCLVGVAVAVGCLAAAGCPDDESPAGIETARSEMKPLVDAACDWMFGCCSADELTYQVGTFTADADNCSERLLDALEAGVPLGLQQGGLSNGPAEGMLALALSVNEGRVSVNGDAVQTCADATADTVCNSAVIAPEPGGRCTPGDGDAVVNPCDPAEMFQGKQGVGEECSGEFECQGSMRCVSFGPSGICARRGEVGEFCFEDQECSSGLICDYAEGTCSEGKLLNEACAFVDPTQPIPGTESVRCADGLACDPTALLCVGGYCAPGAPCNDTVNDSDCPESYYCSGDLMGLMFTCQPPSPDGTPCVRDETCASDYCDFLNGGVCGSLLLVGEACDFGDECKSGFCDMNTCAEALPPGSECPNFDDGQCDGGYCDTIAAPPVCTAYAGNGGACPNGTECDPAQDLACVEATCRPQPFADGVACGDGSQCESTVCFEGLCTQGSPIGATCALDGSIAQCVLGAFCESVEGAATGSCKELLRPGSPCLRSEQCWGECTVRFGRLMCDATPAFALGEVWCDEG